MYFACYLALSVLFTKTCRCISTAAELISCALDRPLPTIASIRHSNIAPGARSQEPGFVLSFRGRDFNSQVERACLDLIIKHV